MSAYDVAQHSEDELYDGEWLESRDDEPLYPGFRNQAFTPRIDSESLLKWSSPEEPPSSIRRAQTEQDHGTSSIRAIDADQQPARSDYRVTHIYGNGNRNSQSARLIYQRGDINVDRQSAKVSNSHHNVERAHEKHLETAHEKLSALPSHTGSTQSWIKQNKWRLDFGKPKGSSGEISALNSAIYSVFNMGTSYTIELESYVRGEANSLIIHGACGKLPSEHNPFVVTFCGGTADWLVRPSITVVPPRNEASILTALKCFVAHHLRIAPSLGLFNESEDHWRKLQWLLEDPWIHSASDSYPVYLG